MNKLTKIIIIVLILLTFITPNTVLAEVINPIDVFYTPDTSDLANPERGFMKNSSIYLDQPFSAGKVGRLVSTDTVAWIYFRLDNYRDARDGYGQTISGYQGKPLEPVGSGKGLDVVKSTFDTARNMGMKLVIRFIYNPGPASSTDPLQMNPDVPIDVALSHIEQLKPLLQANSDVIVAVQGGFVGHWGEWHSSKYMSDNTSRKRIIDALLTAVPKERMIMIRYPRYKQLFYGGPTTDATAYNGSDTSRVGYHDDAFLKDELDDGMFKSNTGGVKVTTFCDNYPTGEAQCWRDFVYKDAKFLPMGGEAGTHATSVSVIQGCANTLVQMNNMHWSVINNGYNKIVLDAWVNQGCMPEIRQRLGYRFVMKKLTVSKQTNPGGVLGFHLELENKGFAAPFNSRPVFAVLKNNATGLIKEIPIPTDPRRWFSGTHIIDANLIVPSDTPAGTYSLYLWLPDTNSSLRLRSQYSIRMANQNTWQTNGYNLLSGSIGIGGAPSTPGPNPSDVNGDGRVNIIDIGIVIDFYGQVNPSNPKTDVNGDGKVNIIDIGILIDNYGK